MPARKKSITPRSPRISKADKDQIVKNVIQNGLSEAILGFNPGSIGVQLSQIDTLFKNMRWYLISNMRQPLSQAYVEHGLIQTVVDVPVDDGMRGGIEVQSDQLSEDQIQDLETEMERQEDLITMGQALKWNRLFGGAGVLILTGQESSEPLDINDIGPDDDLEFRAVDMWELFYDKQNTEGYNPELQTYESDHFNYYGKRIHKSRVMKMKGLTPPSFIRPRLRGWGFSIVEQLIRSINQYLKANDLTFEVLDEFKLDVFKVKNLTNTLVSAEGTQQVQRRIQLANQQKNFQHAIVMDSEDDYLQKQLTFSGLAEVMVGIRMQIASDLRMPLTKVFGISAAGFSSGQDDIENYNAMVESQVRAKSKFEILKMAELRCQKLFGFVPDDLTIKFQPLRVLSAEQEENVKTQKFTRIHQAATSGLMSVKEFKESCNKDDLLGIQLDTSLDLIPMNDDEADEGSPRMKDPEEKLPASHLKTGMPKSTVDEPKEAPQAKNSKDEIGAWLTKWKLVDKMAVSLLQVIANEVIANPGKVDEPKWEKAKEVSKAAFKEIKWPFVTWYYKEHGGHFG